MAESLQWFMIVPESRICSISSLIYIYIQQRTRVLITNLNYNETSFCVSWDFLDFVENNLKNTNRFPNPISSSFVRTKLPQHRGVLCSRSHVRNGDRRKLIQWYPMACRIQGITKIFRPVTSCLFGWQPDAWNFRNVKFGMVLLAAGGIVLERSERFGAFGVCI